MIWLKNFHIDNIIEKKTSMCGFYMHIYIYIYIYMYIFDFITYFYDTFVNIKLLLIFYLCSQMVITVFQNILSNNSESNSYQYCYSN